MSHRNREDILGELTPAVEKLRILLSEANSLGNRALDLHIEYLDALRPDTSDLVGCHGGAPYMTHYGRVGCARCCWVPLPDRAGNGNRLEANFTAVEMVTPPHVPTPEQATCGCEACLVNRKEAINEAGRR